jgi:hypothetical protein
MPRRDCTDVQHGVAVVYTVAIVWLLIRFSSGYAPGFAFWSDAGARVRIGMKRLISSWFNNRLPFEKGMDAAAEYPYAVTSRLSYGALRRAR